MGGTPRLWDRGSGGARYIKLRRDLGWPCWVGGAETELTGEPALLHEVAHELGFSEEDVIHLVHAETVHLIDVLPPVQVIVKRLHFPYTRNTVSLINSTP